jgi:hypothetical protein
MKEKGTGLCFVPFFFLSCDFAHSNKRFTFAEKISGYVKTKTGRSISKCNERNKNKIRCSVCYIFTVYHLVTESGVVDWAFCNLRFIFHEMGKMGVLEKALQEGRKAKCVARMA